MSATPPDLPTAGDYLAVLRRRWALIVVSVVVAGMAAQLYVAVVPDEYESSATVLVRPITRDPLEAYDRAGDLVDLQTELQLVTSPLVVDRARPVIGDAPVDEVQERMAVEAPGDADVMRITYRAPGPSQAAAGANALAEAYLAVRLDRGSAAISGSTDAIEERLAELSDELEDVSATIAATADDPESLDAIDAQNRRTLLQGQISLLSAELAQRLSTSIDAGEVIAPAVEPAAPSSPQPVRAMIVALLAGAVLGVLAAFVRDRLDDNLRDAGVAGRALHARVLAVVPGGGGLRTRNRSMVNAYRRLAVTLDDRRPDALIVASYEPLAERTSTAVNLAITLAEEHRVLLVDVPSGHPAVQELLNSNLDAARRGLVVESGVGREIVELHQPAPLHLIAAESSSPASSRYGQSKGTMTALLDVVGGAYDFVIVDAAPLSESTDALELREVSSGVVFAVRVGDTRLSDLAEAAETLDQVGLRILGVVVHTKRRRRGRVDSGLARQVADAGASATGRGDLTSAAGRRAGGTADARRS
ncbi:Wzz/FepE/Etk N-terminal domain-containing protein [Euzebya sp.]|uniref:Wzz/FepE/Etk N-terminal domain-containing protein n=1 Tax=Euzebya sp. TaxID=1971409 RepID=UPI0035151612